MTKAERDKRLEEIGVALVRNRAEWHALLAEHGKLQAERKAEEIEVQHPITREVSVEDRLRDLEAIIGGKPLPKRERKARGVSAEHVKDVAAALDRLRAKLSKRSK